MKSGHAILCEGSRNPRLIESIAERKSSRQTVPKRERPLPEVAIECNDVNKSRCTVSRMDMDGPVRLRPKIEKCGPKRAKLRKNRKLPRDAESKLDGLKPGRDRPNGSRDDSEHATLCSSGDKPKLTMSRTGNTKSMQLTLKIENPESECAKDCDKGNNPSSQIPRTDGGEPNRANPDMDIIGSKRARDRRDDGKPN